MISLLKPDCSSSNNGTTNNTEHKAKLEE